jgi:metal-responsive CopG/Arc/MetJ family transcriptional regulator
MKKRVGFTLQPEVVKQVKTLIDENKYSKIIRSFFHTQYELPQDIGELSAFQQVETAAEPIRLDQDTIDLLDLYVKQAKDQGLKANRSLIMRHAFAELLKHLRDKNGYKSSQRKRVSFYFEKGTAETLYRYIARADRNTIINQFILQEYQPSSDAETLKIRPRDTENFIIEMQQEAFDRLDQFVEKFGVKGVTRTALMRDAVAQLIEKLSNTTSNEIMVENRLDAAIRDYKETFGHLQLREKLSEYITKG